MFPLGRKPRTLVQRETPAHGTLGVQMWKQASLGPRHSQQGGEGQGKEKKRVRVSRSEKSDRCKRTPDYGIHTTYLLALTVLTVTELEVVFKHAGGVGHRQGDLQ